MKYVSCENAVDKEITRRNEFLEVPIREAFPKREFQAKLKVMPNILHRSTVLITGASAGIGWEFARQLAPLATRLILVARRLDRLEELKTELTRQYPQLKIDCEQVDLAETAQLESLISRLQKEQVPINLLINNAGLGDYGDFESSSWEKNDRILKVNITALTRLTHALLPALQAQPQAAILNVSSVASFIPMPGFAVYAASKAYVSSLSEALRAELESSSISVTNLCPGPVQTEFSSVAARSGKAKRVLTSPLRVDVKKVVRDALNGLVRKRARVVPGWKVACVMGFLALLPLIALRPLFILTTKEIRSREEE